METFAACYFSIKNGPTWTCKSGFDSYMEADNYSRENHTRDKIPDLHATTLIGINKAIPNFLNEKIIAYEFAPRVIITP